MYQEVVNLAIFLIGLYFSKMWLAFRKRHELTFSCTDLLQRVAQLVFIYRINLSTGVMKLFPITPNLYDYYGVESADYKDKGLETFPFIHPDDQRQINFEVYQCIAQNKPFQASKRIRGPDGIYKWIRVKSSYIGSEGDDSLWLGLMDSIEDLQQLCYQQEQSRSMITALEKILCSTFTHILYVDSNLSISRDEHQDGELECLMDWLVLDGDKKRLQSLVLDATRASTHPLPVMMEADVIIRGTVSRHKLFIVNVPRTGVDKTLVCLRPVKRNTTDDYTGALQVIEIPIEGDITELVGYFYSIMEPCNRDLFAQAWKGRLVEDCLHALRFTRVGNLDILSPLREPLSLHIRAVVAVFMFCALSGIEGLPSVDRASVYMHACERAMAISDKVACARSSFYLAMSSMKVTQGSLPLWVVTYLFETSCRLLSDSEWDDALYMLTILKLQRGIFTWTTSESPQEAKTWMADAASTDDRDTTMSLQIKAVVLYNTFILQSRSGSEKESDKTWRTLERLVSRNSDVTFDPMITQRLNTKKLTKLM